VIVGINSTYRGDQLGQLIRHTDCQLIVTNPDQRGLLDGVDTGVPADRAIDVGSGAIWACWHRSRPTFQRRTSQRRICSC
jgi:hypothetical protein